MAPGSRERGGGAGGEEPGAGPGDEGPGGPARGILPANRYAALVGVAFLVVAGIALFNVLTSGEPGTLGFGYDERGEPLEPFALPAARSDLEGDANVDPEEACEVEVEGAIRVCDFFDRPLVISFWFDRGGECIGQQDVLSDVTSAFGDRVGALSINVRDERERVRELAIDREWSMPVGHDRDGAVSNLYRVGGCPTYVLATPGGRLYEAAIGELDREELASKLRRLRRASGRPAGRGSPG